MCSISRRLLIPLQEKLIYGIDKLELSPIKGLLTISSVVKIYLN